MDAKRKGWTLDPQTFLSRFGLSDFRPGQREVIDAVLDGRDVLCVLPTGGGKSLCYQLPALAMDGVTLVVSPLIALMKDQEDHLLRHGIRVTALHSGLESHEQHDRIARIASGEFDIVYVAPERFRSSRFVEALRSVRLALLAIDEAHCISEWGHDFRPDYLRLGWIRREIGMPTTIALTATATDVVRRDIVEQTRLRDPAIFVRGFDRPNLRYQVTPTSNRAAKSRRLLEIVNQTPGSMILYASSRRSCEEVAESLRGQTKRTVVVYHAGLMPDERRQAQDAFMNDRADIVVATNAFGMGIDKPDIRAVVHYNLPGTLEALYQEAGRAGRDGEPAHCELLFSMADRSIQEFFVENEYPSRPLVGKVLEFLRSLEMDPIELTRSEMKDRLGSKVGEMALGATLKLLEGAGAIERLRPRQNMAILRLHETTTGIDDLVPRNASKQRRVARFVENFVGDRRGQDCYFHPEGFAGALEMDRSATVRALQELSTKIRLEYIPPFRGSATRVLDRETPVEDLAIDFDALLDRKLHELGKLDRVIDYARTSECRRTFILRYFGEHRDACGTCDNCVGPSALRNGRTSVSLAEAMPAPDDAMLAVVRESLAAVSELRGRFGKGIVAQTLAGSSAKSVTRFGLQKRRCFGALSELQQKEIVEILEGLLLSGLVEQTGDNLRPTVAISSMGTGFLEGSQPLPGSLPFSAPLWRRLSTVGRSLGAGSPDPPVRSVATAECEPRRNGRQPTPPEEPVSISDRAASEDDPFSNPAPKLSQSRSPSSSSPSPSSSDRPRATRTKPEANGSVPDYRWTVRLFEAGFDVAECQAIRRLSPDTIVEHALTAVREGRELSPEPFRRYDFDQSLASRVRELLDAIGE